MAHIPARPTRATRAKHGGEKPSIEERLLEATERLLQQGHKFAALSVEQLASEAGIARATFYLHFRDKGELVARIMGQLTQEVAQSNTEWFSGSGGYTPEAVRQAVAGTVRTFKKHQAIVAAINDTASVDENVAALFNGMVDSLSKQSCRSFAVVRQNGAARPGVTDDVLDAFTWMVVLHAARAVGSRNGAELTRLVKTMGDLAVITLFNDAAAEAVPPRKRAALRRAG